MKTLTKLYEANKSFTDPFLKNVDIGKAVFKGDSKDVNTYSLGLVLSDMPFNKAYKFLKPELMLVLVMNEKGDTTQKHRVIFYPLDRVLDDKELAINENETMYAYPTKQAWDEIKKLASKFK